MSRFDQMYQEIRKYFAKGEYEKAIEIAQLTARTIIIPQDKKFLYHEAVAMSFLMSGKWREGWSHVRRCMKYGDTPVYRENRRQVFSNLLTYLHFLPDLPDEEIFAMHWEYGNLFADIEQYTHDKNNHARHKKIKVGYVSPDFYQHIVTHFAVQLYAAYDHERFEVHLYNTGMTHNAVTNWLSGLADGWHDLHGYKASEIAAQIYADEIDILVDLGGHTKGGLPLRAMAYKPAPIQMSGIGYFDTTGLPAIDYYLTDNYCDPAGNEKLFTEKLLCLPHSHLCYTPPETVMGCKAEWHLHKPIVFGSFNNFFKLNDAILQTWRKIMEKVPDSRLLLKNVHPVQKELDELYNRMKDMGFAMERVELRLATNDYLDEYADMDIALDTFPYPGGGTTCEAIYMGVPVVSRYGTRHGSRFGYSLLCNMGLEELTASTEEEYIERAVSLAKSPNLVQDLHANLRQIMQASPVMDAKGYLRDIESAYMGIYNDWLRNAGDAK